MNTRFFRILFGLTAVALFMAPIPSSIAQEDHLQRQGIRPDAPSYGVRGPYPVGTMELIIEPDSERPLITTAWYPALNPKGVEEVITYHMLPSVPDMPFARQSIMHMIPGVPGMAMYGHALQDAAPDTANGPYPLIVFSHGRGGTRLLAPYYAEHLASYGFVVLAPDHFGDLMTADIKGFAYNFYYRPLDITRTIDAAEELTTATGALSGLIDTDYVGITGISFGGYTSLMAGGAQINLSVFNTFCEAFSTDPRCAAILGGTSELAALAGLDVVPDEAWPSWGDPRVDAIVPIVPGPGVIGEGSSGVSIPTLLMLGSADSMAIPAYNGHPIWENLGGVNKTLVEFQGADHAFSIMKCADAPWAGYAWWCTDPVWDMDRAHDLVDHFATAFFLATLKSDAEAAANLAPDAVNFTGIRYETTGF